MTTTSLFYFDFLSCWLHYYCKWMLLFVSRCVSQRSSFISFSKKRKLDLGQSASAKDSFSSFIAPHRLWPLRNLFEFLNHLLLLIPPPKLGPRVYRVTQESLPLWYIAFIVSFFDECWAIIVNLSPLSSRVGAGVEFLQSKSKVNWSTEWVSGVWRGKLAAYGGVWVFLVIMPPKSTILTSKINSWLLFHLNHQFSGWLWMNL